jgi:hypothetical protein
VFHVKHAPAILVATPGISLARLAGTLRAQSPPMPPGILRQQIHAARHAAEGDVHLERQEEDTWKSLFPLMTPSQIRHKGLPGRFTWNTPKQPGISWTRKRFPSRARKPLT